MVALKKQTQLLHTYYTKIKSKEVRSKLKDFTEHTIWRINFEELPPPRKKLYRAVKMILLARKGFIDDKCSIRASALTFYSLLSVVPVLAMAFGIAQGFGLQQVLENAIRESMKGQEEVVKYMLDFSRSMLQTTQGGMIAGIGLIVLFWSVMKLLINIESAFNSIWEVKKQRSYVRKFTDYLSIILFGPVLIIMSSSSTVFITQFLHGLLETYDLLNYISWLFVFLINLIPYVLVWILFTLLYIIIPNTKVGIKSAVVSGIIAGTAFQITQWAYITFQVGVGKYNAIYGSFAALPLFLIWLQLSWLIILLGAQLSFAFYNVDKYRVDRDIMEISNHYRRQLSLLIMVKIVRKFLNGETPPRITTLSDELHIPQHYVNGIISDLINVRIIAEVRTETEGIYGFLPAIDVNKLSVNNVIEKLDIMGKDEITVSENEDFIKIKKVLDSVKDIHAKSLGNKLIKDIAEEN